MQLSASAGPAERAGIREGDRAPGLALMIQIVAKRKRAWTISGEQSDRQLSARASRPTGP
jgi:hypothetical protein